MSKTFIKSVMNHCAQQHAESWPFYGRQGNVLEQIKASQNLETKKDQTLEVYYNNNLFKNQD